MQVALSSPDEEDEDDDAHLLIDWRNAAAAMARGGSSKVAAAATAVANVVCLDSESESDAVIVASVPAGVSASCADTRLVLTSSDSETAEKADKPKPVVVGLEAAAPAGASKRKRSAEEREQDKREEKQRKAEQKEVEKQKRREAGVLRKREKEAQKQQQQEAARKEREADKLRKAEVKAKAAAARKLEQEKGKWEKGKFALDNTVALIDCKVIESSGLIGGQLVSRFKEKGLKFHLVSNPVERSILWRMKRPSRSCDHQDAQGTESDMQLQLEDVDAPYLLLVFEPEEFSALIAEGSHYLDDHVRRVRSLYPGYTVCYLVNKLISYLQKKDQQQYKKGSSGWVRPNADKALAELVTNYTSVHSRLCLDEAEVADHVVGLTRSLAECPFKQKLSSLFVNKNGDHVVQHDPHRETIKKNIWLKALVALPKVSGAAAIAISKVYPTLRSLLDAYLDPAMTVSDKELLLQDIEKESCPGGAGASRRRIGPACSRHIYRIMMAQNGDLKTEDVDQGADHFVD